MSCATLEEFLRFAPEFGSVGTVSWASLDFTSQPSAGEVFTLADQFASPPVSGSLIAVAGAPAVGEFQIGVDEVTTAANFSAAVALHPVLSGLITSSTVLAVVQLVSIKSGAASAYELSSEFGELSNPTLAHGRDQVDSALGTACDQLDSVCWGAKQNKASIYLAAHELDTVRGKEGGEIKKKKIDKIEIERQATGLPSNTTDLGKTKWGRLYLALKRTIFVAPVVGRSSLYG